MGVKQTIPSSTNAPKTLNFAKLRGLDCSTSPFEVSTSRAVDMKNIINEDGINHKRPGWKEFSVFVDGGKVSHAFDAGNGKRLLAGNNAIIVTDSDWKGIKIFSGYDTTNVIFRKLSDNKILINFTKDSSYEYYVLDMEKLEIEQIKYTPTTTISINDDSVASTRKSFEEPSLITNKRINKIISNDKAHRLTVQYEGTNEYEFINRLTFTNNKLQSISWEREPLQTQPLSKTAVLLEDVYTFDIKLKLADSCIVYKKTDDGEEAITSIDLKEDTIIYVKEA